MDSHCAHATDLPPSQSLSFQNGDVSPFSLHCFHTARPVILHHQYLVPLAGLMRVLHLFSAQKGDDSPFSLHCLHSILPLWVQNHHRLLYCWIPPPPPPLVERQLLKAVRKFLCKTNVSRKDGSLVVETMKENALF
jgi:hypothetical protein